MGVSRSSYRAATRAITRIAAVIALACLTASCASEPAETPPTQTPSPAPTQESPTEEAPDPNSEPAFDREEHSIDDPQSIWVVSNKLRPLNPHDFEPDDLIIPEVIENEFTQPLREPAAIAVQEMHAAAAKEGVYFRIISAYRDYYTQVALYDRYVQRDGQVAADTYSARPGHSEHQSGLVVDLDDGTGCYLDACFAETEAGVWLGEHAAEHGFIIRYPEGLDGTTGFIYEPWHFRYVGAPLAEELHRSDTRTLEEFFDLQAAPDYAQ